MILILTTEAGDFSHVKLIDWLVYLGADYKIISGEAILRGDIELTLKRGVVYCDGINLSNNVSCVYFRRWITGNSLEVAKDIQLNKGLNSNLMREMQEIVEFLSYNLRNAIWIPEFNSINVNKLTVLEKAKSLNINIPEYLVTNNKSELKDFFDKYKGGVITKAIGNFSRVTSGQGHLVNSIYTKCIDEALLSSLPNKFCLSFFQQNISKILEYRIFYFDRKIYPAALLSQENIDTQLDSRMNNGKDGETKMVPAKINRDFEEKIICLMEILNLNIGSIDVIRSKDDKYYLLEVNPVGQIGGYSKRCNYDLEKIIAEKLMNIDNNGKKD